MEGIIINGGAGEWRGSRKRVVRDGSVHTENATSVHPLSASLASRSFTDCLSWPVISDGEWTA